MSLLVTGANGFLGSAVINKAKKNCIKVRGTDKDSKSRIAQLDYYQADIMNFNSLFPIFQNISTVIHAAGLAHVFKKSKSNVSLFKNINEIGTENVATAAAKSNVNHFILISSVSVYGGSREGGHEDSGCYGNDPYSISKYGAELIASKIAYTSGMALTILRLSTLYGEGDPGNVSRLMKLIDRRCFIWIGDGSNRKSLLHKDDAARACLVVAQRSVSGVHIYNVSSPACMMIDVVNSLADALGRRIWPVRIPAFIALFLSASGEKVLPFLFNSIRGVVTKWLSDDIYDENKFNNAFNFSTRVTLKEGLRKQVDLYRGLNFKA